MKTRCGFALVVLLVLGMVAARGQDQAKQDTDNGYWWIKQSETYKLGFVNGYTFAMALAADTAFFRCLAEKNGGVIPEKLPADDVWMPCEENKTRTHFIFNGIRLGQLVEGVDEFYKDFRNKGVKVSAAIFYVRDELKGKPAKELADELEVYRHGTPQPTN